MSKISSAKFLAKWFANLPLFPFYSKDVRLPVQLQRAMAAEAEAAREARAKVSERELDRGLNCLMHLSCASISRTAESETPKITR